MVQLELSHREVLLMMLDYCREHNLLSTMLALEEEAGLSLFKYSNEIHFLRQLILEGNWPQVENLLKAVAAKGNFELRKAMFQIKRQTYLEMLQSQQIDKNALQWVVQDLQPYCDEETFHSLCMILSLPKLTDSPQFKNWSISKGRLSCFQAIRKLFQNVYKTEEKRRAPFHRLTKLLRDAILFQYHAAKRTGSKPQFKFDPISQSSEASLLKDLISIDQQKKFISQNVPELKVLYHTRSINSNYFKIPAAMTEYTAGSGPGSPFVDNLPLQSSGGEQSTIRKQTSPLTGSMLSGIGSKNVNLSNSLHLPPGTNFNDQRINFLQSISGNDVLIENKIEEETEEYDEFGQAAQPKTKTIVPRRQPPSNFEAYEDYGAENSDQIQVEDEGVTSNDEAIRQQERQHQSLIVEKYAQEQEGYQEYQDDGLTHADYQASVSASMMLPNTKDNNSLIQSMPNIPHNLDLQNDSSGTPNSNQPRQQLMNQQMFYPTQNLNQEPQNQIVGRIPEEVEQQKSQQQLPEYYQINRKPQYHHQRKNSNNQPSQHQSSQQQMMLVNSQPQLLQNPNQQEQVDTPHEQQPRHRIIASSSNSNFDQNKQKSMQMPMITSTTEEGPPLQIISDIEPAVDSTMCHMSQLAVLRDLQPIRASCFSPSGDYFVLGTNSKTLKICNLPKVNPIDVNSEGAKEVQDIEVVLEQQNHHVGSIYCVDWSRTERLIATGSNDRLIKLLVCPNLDQNPQHEILEMTLQGHQAIVRSVCFNPTNDLILLSGGQVDKDVKVWNSETGKNIANLSGHEGDIHSIKMAADGSFAISVSTDKKILLFDIRCKSAVSQMDASAFPEMHEVALSSSQQSTFEGTMHQLQELQPGSSPRSSNPMQDSMNGFAAVGHSDGSVSIWNLNMRQCFAHQKMHSQQVRGISYSVDGNFIASAGYDNNIHISDTVNLDNIQIVKTLQHEDKCVSVKWHPYLPLLLSTSADKTARIWYPQYSRESKHIE